MRAREILDEDYAQNLESDVSNLLIGVKGNGVTSLPMDALVSSLQNSGYSVTADSLMMLLQNNPIIANVTPEEIHLMEPETGGDMEGQIDGQDSAERVSDMAQTATAKEN